MLALGMALVVALVGLVALPSIASAVDSTVVSGVGAGGCEIVSFSAFPTGSGHVAAAFDASDMLGLNMPNDGRIVIGVKNLPGTFRPDGAVWIGKDGVTPSDPVPGRGIGLFMLAFADAVGVVYADDGPVTHISFSYDISGSDSFPGDWLVALQGEYRDDPHTSPEMCAFGLAAGGGGAVACPGATLAARSPTGTELASGDDPSFTLATTTLVRVEGSWPALGAGTFVELSLWNGEDQMGSKRVAADAAGSTYFAVSLPAGDYEVRFAGQTAALRNLCVLGGGPGAGGTQQVDESCQSSDIGLNPSSWVPALVSRTKCMMVAVFVPEPGAWSGFVSRLTPAEDRWPLGPVLAVGSALAAPVATLRDQVDGASGADTDCDSSPVGPITGLGAIELTPCVPDGLSAWVAWLRASLLLGVGLAVALRIRSAVMHAAALRAQPEQLSLFD